MRRLAPMTPVALALLFAFPPGPTAPRPTVPEIVFERATPSAPPPVEEIFTMDLGEGSALQRTFDGTSKFLPHFSPDGTRIVYTKFLTGRYGDPTAVTAVAVYDLATGRETVVEPSGETRPAGTSRQQPVWSPDGKRIAFGATDGFWVMNADGSEARPIGRPAGTDEDFVWGDPLWSRDDWIYFAVAEKVGGCFKVRTDRMRPDGSERTRITDGGPNCTPPGFEQSGDADPGISPDGKTIYSSRGLPRRVPGFPELTVRHLFAISTDPWTPGKPELDLSAGSKEDCIAGVPKVAPDGRRILLFLFCPDAPTQPGIVLTDTKGSSWVPVTPGFGPDWNPAFENPRSGPVPGNPPRGRPRVVPPR